MQALKEDTPIAPITINEMDDSMLEAFLVGVRERRFKSYKEFQETEALARETRCEKLKVALTKELTALKKEHELVDKKLEKIEARHQKIRAIKLEMEAL